MLGLEKCSEDDFYQFVYSNSRYRPDNVDGYLFAILSIIFAFLGIGYLYARHTNVSSIIGQISIIFVVVDIFLYKLSRIGKKKYAFKFPKIMIVILTINWFIASIIMYILPLIIAIYKNSDEIVQTIIYAIIIGFVYLICIFVRLIILIRKGEMRKDCSGIYHRLFNGKIGYLGFSVPIIVIASKLARRATISMNNNGFDMGPLVLMLILAFMLQLIISTLIPECIVLLYCKSRFKSFNFSYEAYLNRRKKANKAKK